MYLLPKVLGAFPYRMVGTRNRLSFWWSMSALVFVIWVFLDCLLFFSLISQWKRKPDIMLHLIVIEKISTILAALVPIMENFFTVRAVEVITNAVSKVDAIMKSHGLEAKDGTPHLLSTSVMLTVLFARLIYPDWPRGIYRAVAGIMMSFITTGTIFRIYHDVSLLTTRLEVLNKEVKSLKSTLGSNKLSQLRTLCKCHENICQISDLMADMFSTRILIVVSCCLLHLVQNCYILVYVYLKAYIPSHPILTLCAVGSALLLDAAMLMILVLPCTFATNQAHQFNVHVYQIMIDQHDPHIGLDHNIRLHLQGERRVIFNAGGIFDVDLAVLHTVFVTVANQVVLLYQFTKASPR